MSDDEQKPKPAELPAQPAAKIALEMFRDWVTDNLSFAQLAEKYGVNRSTVYRYSQIYKWRDNRNKLAQKSFDHAVTRMVTATSSMMSAIIDDFNKMEDRRRKRPDQSFDPKERAHIMAMLDRFMKEHRLEQGQPTELSTGQTPTVNLVLPPGVTNFGLVPVPESNIKTVASQPKAEQAPEVSLDLTELEDDKA